MSDAARQNLKVSREGIVLIKSFEGFRPRAIQRAEGGWIIGYGHTLSAREGASVSEADAELLLRYDLMPVEASVNDTVPTDLNQHQFDALVSFAFSVGIDRFASSDVRQRLNAGSPGEAADAIMGWPEPALPETALRRRAAERALFVANPSAPVALSDLLSAPLPPPPVPLATQEPEVEPEAEAIAPVDPRGAAVAALLGEPALRRAEDDAQPTPIIPSFAPPAAIAEPVDTPAPSNDNPPVDDVVEPFAPEAASNAGHLADEPVEPSTPPVEEAAELHPTAAADATVEPASTPIATGASWSAARYAPYSLSMVGPLPYLQPAAPQAASAAHAIDHSVVEIAPAEAETTPTDDLATETPVEAVETELIEPLSEPTPVADLASPTPVEAMVYVAPVAAAPVAELVLTPLEDSPEPAFARPLWTPEERSEPDGTETNLFGEDLNLTLGGSVMRHEIEMEAPVRFDWKETTPFIFMGGVGLVSFGAAMAAFRRAAEQSGGSELTIIGWVLALIGLGCVGVSSINLYRKFGLPGGD